MVCRVKVLSLEVHKVLRGSWEESACPLRGTIIPQSIIQRGGSFPKGRPQAGKRILFLSEPHFIGAILQGVKMPGVSSWVIDAEMMPTPWGRARSGNEGVPSLLKSKSQPRCGVCSVASSASCLGCFLLGFLPKASVKYYWSMPVLPTLDLLMCISLWELIEGPPIRANFCF